MLDNLQRLPNGPQVVGLGITGITTRSATLMMVPIESVVAGGVSITTSLVPFWRSFRGSPRFPRVFRLGPEYLLSDVPPLRKPTHRISVDHHNRPVAVALCLDGKMGSECSFPCATLAACEHYCSHPAYLQEEV